MFKKTILLLLLSSSLFGQVIDSNRVGYSTLVSSKIIPFDTVLNISTYHDFNEWGRDDFGVVSLGNLGDLKANLTQTNLLNFLPNLGIDGYFKNSNSLKSIPFYNVKAPTGGIRFQTAYEKGQMFGAFFTVNPIDRLNIYLDFQRINARGFYFNQQNISNKLKLSTHFSTLNEFYTVASAVSWNKFTNLEFGGIADNQSFEENSLSNRELIAVNLTQSGSRTNDFNLLVIQKINLIRIDSTKLVKMFYEFDVKSQYVAFTSSDSAFVRDAIFEETTIHDSISFSRFNNFIGLSLYGKKHVFDVGINHSYYTYSNLFLSQTENLFAFKARTYGEFEKFKYRAEWENYLVGDYLGTYNLALHILDFSLLKNFTLDASLVHGLYNPGLFVQSFVSNNFNWDNGFKKIRNTNIRGRILLKEKYGFEAGFTVIDDDIYFNEYAVPVQYDGLLSNYYVQASADIKLIGKLRLDNKVRFQQVSNTDILRIPNWVLRNTLYYEVSAFKNALNSHFGIEFEYFDSFKSNAYMPATTVTYLQNDVEIGNYPYFNFFLDFKIQELVFFLRLENITQGLFEYNYYAVPNYARPDFNIRIGATWRFFN